MKINHAHLRSFEISIRNGYAIEIEFMLFCIPFQ